MKISDVVQKSDTGAGRAFDYATLFLVVVSIVLLFAEDAPGLSSANTEILGSLQKIIMVLFTIEYVLRFVTAERKTDYVFSFYGIIDLVCILPFCVSAWTGPWIGTGQPEDFAVIRGFRFLRIFRIMKVGRYNKALDRFGKAVSSMKQELLVFLMVVLMLVCVSGMGVYYFEYDPHKPDGDFQTVLDGLWWAVATLTTVGYGDVYPQTIGGKLFSSVAVLCGLGIVAVPSGIIAAALTKVLRDEDQQ